jgi:hypothetical protein
MTHLSTCIVAFILSLILRAADARQLSAGAIFQLTLHAHNAGQHIYVRMYMVQDMLSSNIGFHVNNAHLKYVCCNNFKRNAECDLNSIALL